MKGNFLSDWTLNLLVTGSYDPYYNITFLAFEEKNRRIKFETLPGGLSTQVNYQKGTIWNI